MIELYHNDMAVCAQKVRLALAELDITWTSHHINLRGTEQFTAEYLAINPKGQVPALVDDEFIVVESNVINEYLAEKFPKAGLIPDTPAKRAQMRWWTRKTDENIHSATAVISMSVSFRHQYVAAGNFEKIIVTIPDEDRRIQKRTAAATALENPMLAPAVRRMDKLFNEMETALSNSEWLVDGGYSLADISMTPYVLRMKHLRMDFMFAERPNLAQWIGAVQARPNFSVGIGEWLNSSYLELMESSGAEVQTKLSLMLAEP